MVCGKLVIAIVVEDHQTPIHRGCTDKQIDDRQRASSAHQRESMLRRVDPSPNRFRHWHIRIEIPKRLIHLIEFALVTSRSSKLCPLGFTRPNRSTQKWLVPRI